MTLLFVFPGNETLGDAVLKSGFERGAMEVHHFPDGETLVRIDSDVAGRDVVLLCSLDHPDGKAMALMFFAETAREMGAASVRLVAPYLSYMRQDKRFHDGEAMTAKVFAAFLSLHFDGLVTVDPHLHRYKDMSEIYTIPARVVHAADAVASWIRNHVDRPVLIGPDEESGQWVSAVARTSGAPFTVLQKTRRGDRDVEISIPDIDRYRDHTPVLVDDIISTARTMAGTVRHILDAGMKAPVCVGIHAVFAGDAFEILRGAGAGRIVTCNTITHPSNAIDVSGAVLEGMRGW